MSRRPGAPRATRLRPSSRWAMCSTASARAAKCRGGRVTMFETRGIEHRIQFRVDHVNNEPKITHTTSPSAITAGTKLTVKWPDRVWRGDAPGPREGPLQTARRDLCLVQPAPDPARVWYGNQFINVEATNPPGRNGGRAIRPARTGTMRHGCSATSPPTWPRDRDRKRHRTVREFIAEFRGLSGTAVQRKVLEEVGCSHQSLASSSASSMSTARASPSCWQR